MPTEPPPLTDAELDELLYQYPGFLAVTRLVAAVRAERQTSAALRGALAACQANRAERAS